jgi:regulator of Ty1 transposition protein 103
MQALRRRKKKRKVELTLREEVDAELAKGSPVEPPQPEELAKALLDLENSASSDAAVREKIAAFPPEVSDVTLIEKVTGVCLN